MNTADLITSFFNNELSPDQERQFLLSVASSDSLRLGLKSHVMLDKILNEELTKSRVPSNIRLNVMKEAAVVAAAAGTFNGGEAFAKDMDPPSETTVSEEVGRSGFWGRIPRWVSAPMVMLLSVGSFFAGYYTGGDDPVEAEVKSGLSTPSVEVESASPTTGVPVELTTVQSGVDKVNVQGDKEAVVLSTNSSDLNNAKRQSSVAGQGSSTKRGDPQSTTSNGRDEKSGSTASPSGISTDMMQVQIVRDSTNNSQDKTE